MTEFKWPLIGGAIALFLALLLVTVGFFKTTFVILLAGLGIGAGFLLQNKGLLNKFKK